MQIFHAQSGKFLQTAVVMVVIVTNTRYAQDGKWAGGGKLIIWRLGPQRDFATNPLMSSLTLDVQMGKQRWRSSHILWGLSKRNNNLSNVFEWAIIEFDILFDSFTIFYVLIMCTELPKRLTQEYEYEIYQCFQHQLFCYLKGWICKRCGLCFL